MGDVLAEGLEEAGCIDLELDVPEEWAGQAHPMRPRGLAIIGSVALDSEATRK
jgi:hypothetical protein